MVKVWYISRPVYHQVEHFTCSWIVMGNYSANGPIGLRPKGWDVSNNLYWSIIIQNNKAISAKYTCVSMGV